MIASGWLKRHFIDPSLSVDKPLIRKFNKYRKAICLSQLYYFYAWARLRTEHNVTISLYSAFHQVITETSMGGLMARKMGTAGKKDDYCHK
ncbi:MAG: hypothetical protein MZV63_36810 [Marinilabiliales bacterium]|nr:hypothetical protein [Marinilabiliales bacterium]